MSTSVTLQIDSSKQLFYITGAINKILLQKRAKLHLKDYLLADLSNPESIIIPYEENEREKTLDSIYRFVDKFSLKLNTTQEVKDVLQEYFQERENFEIFSRQANLIRNNLLDDEHIQDFANFTEKLNNKLQYRRLYELQLLSAYHLTFSQNAANFSVPGAGKTTIVYAAYAYLSSLPTDNPKYVNKLLIIGPLSSFGPWEQEYESCFGHEPSAKRLSGGADRSDRIKQFYSSNPAEITLISYNSVVNYLEDIIYFLRRFKVMVVLDEAHKIKNVEGGIIATSILSIAKYCKSRVVLTGTPAPNGYEDIYNLFKFIWPTKKIIQFNLFNLKDMSENPEDSRIPKLITDISPFFLRIRKNDLKIPEPINHPPIVVRMGEHQGAIYDFIEQKYLEYFENAESYSDLRSYLVQARLIRLLQASTNPSLLQKPLDDFFSQQGIPSNLYLDDSSIINQILSYNVLEIPPKFLEAKNLIESLLNNNQKVVVWAIFIQNLLDFSKYLQECGISSKVLYGAVPIELDEPDENIETREAIIREFHKPDSSFKVLIANPFAVSESISLHKACKNAIYIERSFNAAQFIQSKDRIHRYGLQPTDKVNYYYIVSDNAIDETIHERLIMKEDRMMRIIENEPIPLFSRIDDNSENDDIKALIDNYVRRASKI